MVTRAAGLPAASAPQPPRNFIWPLALETPGSASSALHLFRPARSPECSRRVENPALYSPGTDSKELPEGGGCDSGASTIGRVRPEARHEIRLRENPILPEQNVSAADLAYVIRSGFDQSPHTPAPVLPVKSHETSGPADILPDPPEGRKSRTIQVSSPHPMSHAAGETIIKDAAVRVSQETPESPVEVKIGRVEIRFDAPLPQAGPSQSPSPRGFDEFAALRRYAVQSWSSGSR